MNLENALKIEGWMELHDLEWLAAHARGASRIVEVGSWHGRSTTVLADNTDGIVFAVDTWGGSEEHRGSMPDLPDKSVYRDFCERTYQSFLRNMQPYIDRGKVIPVHLPSVEAASIFRACNQMFDFVFIDAAHDYENIKADIAAWTPLVKGLLCGHDAGHAPVMQATQEAFPNRPPNECSMWLVNL